MTRTVVNLLRLPPGGEWFTYHAHLYEEEWIYLRSGRPVLDDGDAHHEVGAGDFVPFPGFDLLGDPARRISAVRRLNSAATSPRLGGDARHDPA